MHLLDLYKSRFGTAVKAQGNGWNGPCPLCGGEPGKSDRFMVWPERAESLGETCAAHNITGIWSCRQCGASGDTIAYLMKVEGMDFKAALAELGIEGGRASHRRRRAPQEPGRSGSARNGEPRQADASAWSPREWPEPSDEWCTYAAKLLAEAEERIWKEPLALRWLAARGITEEAVRVYHIGYLPAESAKYPGRWRYRSALGLEPKQADDGTLKQKIFIPRGIVIPTFAAGGRVMNLRIRRHKEDLTERASKYMELEGSCKAPLLLRSSRPNPLAVYFATEAELDAMLIHFSTGGVIGAVAVRTNRGKPDAAAHARLRDAVRVCVALDYDDPGADGVDFWERTYPQYLRWPTPEGKDPGDAYRLGVDIREWVAEALPACVALATDDASRTTCGQTDTLPSGSLKVGGGDRPETALPENGSGPAGLSEQMRISGEKDAAAIAWATEDAFDSRQDGGYPRSASAAGTTFPANESECPAGRGTERHFSEDELCRLRAALPPYLPLNYVPADVARAYLLWRGAPVTFFKFRDENGDSTGFSWERDYTWCRKNFERFEAFWRFQDGSSVLWQWMSDHCDMEITSKNLLHIWGKA